MSLFSNKHRVMMVAQHSVHPKTIEVGGVGAEVSAV